MLDTVKNTERSIDAILRDYHFLKTQADFISERLDSLKELLKDIGTCSSENYVCMVENKTRTVGPNKKTLEELLGEGVYAAHSKKVTYKTIVVKQKH